MYKFHFEVVWENLSVLLKGVRFSLTATVLALALGLIIGLLVALGRLSGKKAIAYPLHAYIDFFRCTPALVQLIWIYYVVPTLVPSLTLSALQAGVLALSLNSGAFLAEIFRAGIQSIDSGQRDAAQVLGLSRLQTMRHVVLPQALRRMLPPIGSTAISLLKDSSLLSVIAVPELMYQGQTAASRTFRPLEMLSGVAAVYFLMTYPLSLLVSYVERRYQIRTR